MDSMDLEREKGITIRAKNASFTYKDFFINVVDTPGHADFGGEVERIMNMIDGVILVVDAYEGPQAQTRFVLKKALESGAKPMVVINKIDRENADPAKVVDLVSDLFLSLAASDDQLDFPVLYASAKDGYAMKNLEDPKDSIEPLFDAIVSYFPSPRIEESSDEFKTLVANLDYSEYLGRIAFGKILSGSIKIGDPMVVLHGNGSKTSAKVSSLVHFDGLKRIEIQEAHAGDIIGLTGCEDVYLGETIAKSVETTPLPFVPVDPPTLCMQFCVNDGPMAGLEGKLITARHIRERLEKEVLTNISLRFNDTPSPTIFEVRGRGEMQISVLVEQMRREGFELLVSRPEVIFKKEGGSIKEPFEQLFCEVPNDSLGGILESLANRKAEIINMEHQDDMVAIEAVIPMRGLIGFESELVNSTRGLGIMSHLFHEYAPIKGEIAARKNGSLVSMESGKVTAYSLDTLQQRAKLMVVPGDIVYPGMIVGENARGEDMTCNPTKEKKLTNMRSSGDGKGIILDAPLKLSLEKALEYIGDDEYVEVTPESLRLRKKILDATMRKREANKKAALVMAE